MKKNWLEILQIIEESIGSTLKGLGKVFFFLTCLGLTLGGVLDSLKKKNKNN